MYIGSLDERTEELAVSSLLVLLLLVASIKQRRGSIFEGRTQPTVL